MSRAASGAGPSEIRWTGTNEAAAATIAMPAAATLKRQQLSSTIGAPPTALGQHSLCSSPCHYWQAMAVLGATSADWELSMVRLLLKRQTLSGRRKVRPSQSDEGKRAENGSGNTKKHRSFPPACLADSTLSAPEPFLEHQTDLLAKPCHGITGSCI